MDLSGSDGSEIINSWINVINGCFFNFSLATAIIAPKMRYLIL